jgi:hypothetical protein
MLNDTIDSDPDLFEGYEDAFREYVWRGTIRHAVDRSLWLINPVTGRLITPEEAYLALGEGVLPNNPLQWEVVHPLDHIQSLQISQNNITTKIVTLTARYAAWNKAQEGKRKEDRDEIP